MAEPRSGRSLVRYYCTAGNGMESFLVQEVKTKLAAENVCHIPGKVLFSSSAAIDRVRELKAAERLFLLLRQDSPVMLPTHTSPAKAASVLQSRLLGDRSQWDSAVMTWSRLQRELASRGTTVNTPSTAMGLRRRNRGEEKRGSERRREEEEEEKWDGESRKSTREQKNEGNWVERKGEEEKEIERKKKEEEESGDGRSRRNGQNETQTSENKRKREDEDEEYRVERERGVERREEEQESGDGKNRTQTLKRKREEEERRRRNEVWVCNSDRTTPGRGHDAERTCSKMGDSGAGADETRRQPSRDKPEPSPPVPISFRISCKCTGALSRRLSTQELSRVIGAGLSRLLGWKADLKNPQLEVNVYLSDDHCLLGIPLTRLPLANRSYMRTTGLRSTVAWAMGSLAQIQPGSCVVDPMCGGGAILMEAAREHKDAHFLGMDIDDGQLQRANENVAFGDLRNISLLKGSSLDEVLEQPVVRKSKASGSTVPDNRYLPLPSGSVDAVVSDLPFGRKFGTKTHMAANLPLILTEMERVLRVGGILVLLLSPQLSCLLKKLQTHPGPGPTSTQETEPHAGLPDCPSPPLTSTKQQIVQSHPLIKSTSTQGTEPPTGLQHRLPAPLSSLKHQATHRVSLGAIDGLIHKYVKIET